MRIATSQIFANTVQNLNNQEAQLALLQQQSSTGVRVATPGDDPLGAARAVQLSAAGSALGQFEKNQETATSMLNTEDSTLGNVTSTLIGVLQQLGAINGGTLNDSNRQSALQALQGLRDQLMSLANTTDGQGNFIFSGFQSGTPFSNASNGGVTYNGDLGTRTMQISGTTSVATADNGASVFLSVLAGFASPVPAGASTNTGTGVISDEVTPTASGAATNNTPYSIVFSNDPATGDLVYQVSDTSTTPPTAIGTPLPFTPSNDGTAIDLNGGESVTIKGTPVAGDSFTVTPAAQGNTDVFATIDSLVAALQNPVQGNPAAMANLENAFATAQAKIGNTMTNVATVQASVAGREQQVTALAKVNSKQTLQNQTDLANNTSADSIQVLSQLTQVQAMLNATEKTFAAVSQNSLFQFINP